MLRIIKTFLLVVFFWLIFLNTESFLIMRSSGFWTKLSFLGVTYSFYLRLFLWSSFSILSILSFYEILEKLKKLSLLISWIFIFVAYVPLFMNFSPAPESYTSIFIQLCALFLVGWFVFRWLEKKKKEGRQIQFLKNFEIHLIKTVVAFFLTLCLFLAFYLGGIKFMMIDFYFWIKPHTLLWSYSFFLLIFIWSLFSFVSILCAYKILGKLPKLYSLVPLFFVWVAHVSSIFKELPVEVDWYHMLFIQLILSSFVSWKTFKWLKKREALKKTMTIDL